MASRTPSPASDRSRAAALRWLLTGLAVFALLAVVTAGLISARARDAGSARATDVPPPAVPFGAALDRPVPAMPLIDAHGRRTSLAAFRGRFVVLASALTLCHEVCPMTTGALAQIQRTVDRAGLGRRVVVAEATVDPWRDSPARLRAYQRLTGARFRLLTGTRTEIRRLWHFFGVSYRRVPASRPPDVDWWTHRPETMDVEHQDVLLFIDPRGRWRVAIEGTPDVGGRLAPALRGLLNVRGRSNLVHPQDPWTPAQALQDLWQLMGRAAPRGAGRGSEGPPAAQPAPAPAGGAGSSPRLASLHDQANRLLGGGERAVRDRLRGLRGIPVVVNEWASWCPPCRAELPMLARAAASYGRRVAFLGLDVNDNPGDAAAFLGTHPVGYPSYEDPDGTVARALSAFFGVPTTLFYDRRGRLAYVRTGAFPDAATLDQDIAANALGTGP